MAHEMSKLIGRKSLATAANLGNLLPTGTVAAFQALVPSSSSISHCQSSNTYLTLSIIVACSLACFLSSFTDSFVDDNGKLRYGFATWTGLRMLNDDDDADGKGQEMTHQTMLRNGEGYKVRAIDLVHTLGSLIVFLVFALSSSEVRACLLPVVRTHDNALFMYLPLGVLVLTSLLFMVFPTPRRGIGYCVIVYPASYSNIDVDMTP